MDLFTLVAKIIIDTKEFVQGITAAEDEGKKFGVSFQGVGETVKKVAKVTGAAVGAATGAVAKLTTSSVKAYSAFQQLEGGVDTLFGTNGKKTLEDYQKALGITEKSTKKQVDASIKSFQSHQKAYNTVMNNSKTAFKRAGMDQNSYIENVTSFSAALIKSLDGDTAAAAEAADKAIVAMSDNANKMGTDIQSIQNAYQGFAKGNFTMLDNLNTMGALAA